MSQQTQSPQFEIPREAERPQMTHNSDVLPSPVLQERLLSQPEQNLPGTTPSSFQGLPVASQAQTMTITVDPVTQALPQTDTKAEDIDVIEKEWVEKAKKVLSLTGDDPYQGVKQVSLLKAEYMRKRFNRELKLPDEIKERQ